MHTTELFFDEPRGSTRSSRKAKARHQRRTERKAPEVASLPEFQPLNQTQADLFEALKESPQVFVVGPAGTGKTYVAARHAMRQLLQGKTESIVLSRATVARRKHQLGFRPGKQDDKMADWMVPIMFGLKAECSTASIEKLRREGKIEFMPFETMRGRSIENAILILDEAQNCDIQDLKLFLTRVGENTQVIVAGDTDQVDIDDSGFETVLDMIEAHDMSAEIIEFDESDVVRSATAKEWVTAFRSLVR